MQYFSPPHWDPSYTKPAVWVGVGVASLLIFLLTFKYIKAFIVQLYYSIVIAMEIEMKPHGLNKFLMIMRMYDLSKYEMEREARERERERQREQMANFFGKKKKKKSTASSSEDDD